MLEGDFSFIQTESHRNMLQAAYDAISNVVDGWEFLKNYSPPPDKGFMFCESPQKLKDISEAIENGYNHHTGYTYSWTMRQMECIAKKGWDRYVNGYHPKYRITWVMDSGYSGYGEPIFKSLDDATEFVKAQLIQDAISGWKIQYKIECV
jgi:hypothetical protein